MKKGYIGVATNRALSVAHCAQNFKKKFFKKKKKKRKKKKKKDSFKPSQVCKCYISKGWACHKPRPVLYINMANFPKAVEGCWGRGLLDDVKWKN